MYGVADPVVDSWPLMGSPWPVLAIVSLYFLFVLRLGPRLMRDKPPFDLKYVMILYNFYQVAFSSWLCVRVRAFVRSRYFHYRILSCMTSKGPCYKVCRISESTPVKVSQKHHEN